MGLLQDRAGAHHRRPHRLWLHQRLGQIPVQPDAGDPLHHLPEVGRVSVDVGGGRSLRRARPPLRDPPRRRGRQRVPPAEGGDVSERGSDLVTREKDGGAGGGVGGGNGGEGVVGS